MKNLIVDRVIRWSFDDTQCSSTSEIISWAFIPHEGDPTQDRMYMLTEEGRVSCSRHGDDHDVLDIQLPIAKWLQMDYLAELHALFCVAQDGLLYHVDCMSHEIEEIGVIDGGIRTVVWNATCDIVALCTVDEAELMLMSATNWDILAEVPLVEILPHIDPTASIQLAWRGDSQGLALNYATADPEPRRQIAIVNAQLEWQSAGRREDGRALKDVASCLTWSPDNALLASAEHLRRRTQIIFFEANGQRHRELVLRAVPVGSSGAPTVRTVQWNGHSDVLAVLLRCSTLQCWTRRNYHWYLKHERQGVRAMRWDNTRPDVLHILSQDQTLESCRFAWTRSTTMAGYDSADMTTSQLSTVGVIDGHEVKLTFLDQAVIPPPMSAKQVAFPRAINALSMMHLSERSIIIAALCSDHRVYLYQSTEGDESTSASSSKCQLMDDACHWKCFSWLEYHDVQNWQIVALALDGSSFIHCASIQGQVRTCAVPTQGLVSYTLMMESKTQVLLVFENGTIQRLGLKSLHDENDHQPQQQQMLFRMDKGCLWAQSIRKSRGTRHQCWSLDAMTSLHVSGSELWLIKLTASPMVPILIEENCTGVLVSWKFQFVFYTTSKHRLHFCSVVQLCRHHETSSSLDDLAIPPRAIEQHAELLAITSSSSSVILQMPRGNLEVIYPQPLVLRQILAHLRRRAFTSALECARRHRIDTNVLVDVDPVAFLDNLPSFCRAIPANVRADRLKLFITALHSTDVCATKYHYARLSSTDRPLSNNNNNSKAKCVNTVCNAFLSTFCEMRNSTTCDFNPLLCELTCDVKKSPADLVTALTRIQKLTSRSSQSSALKYLLLLVDVDRVFRTALELMDFDLAKHLIVEFCRHDPLEYLNLIELLRNVRPDAKKQYKVAVYLHQYSRALSLLRELFLERRNEEDRPVSDDDDDEEERQAALKLIETHDLAKEALEMFPLVDFPQFHRALQLIYARQLLTPKDKVSGKQKPKSESPKKHPDVLPQQYLAAAQIYLSVTPPEYLLALDAYQKSGNWRMTLSLAKQHLSYSEPEMRKLAYSLASELSSVSDAATILHQFCHDPEEAVTVLLRGQCWEKALELCLASQRLDLVETEIKPNVVLSFDQAQKHLVEKLGQYQTYGDKLSCLRTSKSLFRLHGIGPADVQEPDVELASCASSAYSVMDSEISTTSSTSIHSSVGQFSLLSLQDKSASPYEALRLQQDHLSRAYRHANADRASAQDVKDQYYAYKKKKKMKLKKGSVEEEQYFYQRWKESIPGDELRQRTVDLIHMGVYFGHAQMAQNLQGQFNAYVDYIHEHPPVDQIVHADDNPGQQEVVYDTASIAEKCCRSISSLVLFFDDSGSKAAGKQV